MKKIMVSYYVKTRFCELDESFKISVSDRNADILLGRGEQIDCEEQRYYKLLIRRMVLAAAKLKVDTRHLNEVQILAIEEVK